MTLPRISLEKNLLKNWRNSNFFEIYFHFSLRPEKKSNEWHAQVNTWINVTNRCDPLYSVKLKRVVMITCFPFFCRAKMLKKWRQWAKSLRDGNDCIYIGARCGNTGVSTSGLCARTLTSNRRKKIRRCWVWRKRKKRNRLRHQRAKKFVKVQRLQMKICDLTRSK